MRQRRSNSILNTVPVKLGHDGDSGAACAFVIAVDLAVYWLDARRVEVSV